MIAGVLGAASLLSACASTPPTGPTSGDAPTSNRYAKALAYPDRLQPTGDDGAMRWRDPAVDFRKYDRILIERSRVHRWRNKRRCRRVCRPTLRPEIRPQHQPGCNAGRQQRGDQLSRCLFDVGLREAGLRSVGRAISNATRSDQRTINEAQDRETTMKPRSAFFAAALAALTLS